MISTDIRNTGGVSPRSVLIKMCPTVCSCSRTTEMNGGDSEIRDTVYCYFESTLA